MAKTVRYTSTSKPPLSADERKRLLALSAANEKGIDFSDVPASTDATWKNAVRGRFYRPVKQQVTLRIDANVLDWFKHRTPRGYQTDINRVLADYVAAHDKKAG